MATPARHAVRTLTPGTGASSPTRATPCHTPGASRPAAPVSLAEGADWTVLAACKAGDPDELFVTGAAQNKVKTRCFSCAVRTECLADALDNRVEFGVWGGMTERERRALLRRRPDVTSWAQLLLRARTEAAGTGQALELTRLVTAG